MHPAANGLKRRPFEQMAALMRAYKAADTTGAGRIDCGGFTRLVHPPPPASALCAAAPHSSTARSRPCARGMPG